jgi:hypothetical protein
MCAGRTPCACHRTVRRKCKISSNLGTVKASHIWKINVIVSDVLTKIIDNFMCVMAHCYTQSRLSFVICLIYVEGPLNQYLFYSLQIIISYAIKIFCQRYDLHGVFLYAKFYQDLARYLIN